MPVLPRDTGATNRQLLVDYMERYGRMGALYADRAGHFKMSLRAKERREPREPVDAHRALPEGANLLQIFAEPDERVIDNDFPFRYKKRFYQIDAHDADGAMPKSKITIEERLDGTTRFRWRAGYVCAPETTTSARMRR